MQKENEDKAIRGYGNRKKRYRRTRNLLVLAVFLIVIIVGIVILYGILNRSYHEYKVIKSTELKGETDTGFISYGSSVVKYGKDGAIAYNKEGKIIWNCAYNMADPITDVCGKYIVIGDRGAKQIRVFDNKGAAGEYTTEFNIVKVEVAHQGVVAALMEEGDSNHIKLYDLDGHRLVEMKKSVKDDKFGYPLDISLSNDGTKLAISCLAVNQNDVFSRVGFYNFGGVGKNDANRYVGGYNSDKGVIASRVEFINNDTVCIYKNNGFDLYSMKEIPKRIKQITTKGKIKSILYNSKYAGFVTDADSKSDKKLVLYNLSGKCILDKKISLDYKNIFLTKDEVILHDNLTCNIIRLNGKLKFNKTFDRNITAIYPINNLDQYYLVNDSKLSDIQLGD